ncbi:hypothetical protein [Microbacterium sulfonylureivorans]|uniref:hypothetical protein n=1 Tax=Microbacterium sulfonylureivorans TaxID=2486854 RepID=UPI000FD78C5C|nr:hypothetical protein [Microbacterium sulfonylureivorans]
MLWAIVGGLVLLVGVVAIVIAVITSQQASPNPTTGGLPGTPSPSVSESPPVDDPVVDATVEENGWVAEPVTTDPDAYIRAALAAASSFDTTQATRDEWLTYLDSWFTPDTRYASEADQRAELAAAQLELRQGVVLPEAEWDSLASEDGRVLADVAGNVELVPVPDDESSDMAIGTADVVLRFTREDDAGAESSYDETVRVSVQVLCGARSVPTPDSGQQAGDCKVVRYFTEPMEP